MLRMAYSHDHSGSSMNTAKQMLELGERNEEMNNDIHLKLDALSKQAQTSDAHDDEALRAAILKSCEEQTVLLKEQLALCEENRENFQKYARSLAWEWDSRFGLEDIWITWCRAHDGFHGFWYLCHCIVLIVKEKDELDTMLEPKSHRRQIRETSCASRDLGRK